VVLEAHWVLNLSLSLAEGFMVRFSSMTKFAKHCDFHQRRLLSEISAAMKPIPNNMTHASKMITAVISVDVRAGATPRIGTRRK
jgi:hypothetical protein